MSDFLRFLFALNPRGAEYSSPSMLALLALCVAMIAGSFALQFWRRKQQNSVLRKLSRSWSSVIFWFGIIGLVLVVSRVEGIQFVAMRFMWVLWVAFLLGFALIQFRLFRMRYYAVIPNRPVEDPRDRYIPGKKR